MKPPVMIDLCSGLGGASDPFRAAGWRVVTLDIDRRFTPDVLADVRNAPLRRGAPVTFLWASPPCQQFSLARAGAVRPLKPDMSIVEGVLYAINLIGPRCTR